MKVWIVLSHNTVPTAVFSTERKAKVYAESLEREGIVTYVTTATLNKGVPKSD